MHIYRIRIHNTLTYRTYYYYYYYRSHSFASNSQRYLRIERQTLVQVSTHKLVHIKIIRLGHNASQYHQLHATKNWQRVLLLYSILGYFVFSSSLLLLCRHLVVCSMAKHNTFICIHSCCRSTSHALNINDNIY